MSQMKMCELPINSIQYAVNRLVEDIEMKFNSHDDIRFYDKDGNQLEVAYCQLSGELMDGDEC